MERKDASVGALTALVLVMAVVITVWIGCQSCVPECAPRLVPQVCNCVPPSDGAAEGGRDASDGSPQ